MMDLEKMTTNEIRNAFSSSFDLETLFIRATLSAKNYPKLAKLAQKIEDAYLDRVGISEFMLTKRGIQQGIELNVFEPEFIDVTNFEVLEIANRHARFESMLFPLVWYVVYKLENGTAYVHADRIIEKKLYPNEKRVAIWLNGENLQDYYCES